MTFPFFFPLPSLFSATAPVRPPAPTHCRTPPRPAPICRRAAGAVVALGAALVPLSWAHARVATVPPPPALPPSAIAIDLPSLRTEARVGDLVFIRVAARPFAEVAEATGAWTNHVGVVVAVAGADVQVAESTVPFSRTTPLARFVARSEAGRVALRRLPEPLTPTQAQAVRHGAQRRVGVRYDTGFDLRSRGQFCSRFVREVMLEATGIAVGEVQTFDALLRARPDARLGFWRAWFFGRIPWQRETVTPASQLTSDALVTVFDGTVGAPAR